MQDLKKKKKKTQEKGESLFEYSSHVMGFPGGSAVKNPPAHAEDVGSIPGPGRSPGEGNGNPLQDSCLENPMQWRAWRATVHGIAKELDMTQQLKQLTIPHHTLTTGWWLSKCFMSSVSVRLTHLVQSHYTVGKQMNKKQELEPLLSGGPWVTLENLCFISC